MSRYKVKPGSQHPELTGKVGKFCYDSWNGRTVKVLRFDDVLTPGPPHSPSRYGLELEWLEKIPWWEPIFRWFLKR